MKKIYLLAVLLLFSQAFAQTLNFTDANFKAVLLAADVSNNIAQNAQDQNFKIDANSDGEIQQSEAALVKKLKLLSNGSPEMSAIVELQGIQNFTSLDSLKIRYLPAIQTVNVNGMANLKSVWITGCSQLSNTNFQGCTGLLKIDITSNQALTALSFQNLSLLSEVIVTQNNLQTLSLTGCTALTTLEAAYNHLSTLDLSNMTNLQTVSLNNNNLTSLSLFNNAALSILNISQNTLQNLALNQAPLLSSLSIEQNEFSTLNFAAAPLLTELYCGYNLFVNLDLSAQSQLDYFNCSNNPNLKYIFIKNGKNNVGGGNQYAFYSNPALLYICADEEELATIGYYLSIYNQPNVAYSAYCTFNPGGTFYTLQGSAKYDGNNNGCDANDIVFNTQKYLISDGNGSAPVFTTSLGSYFVPVGTGTHTITPISENPTYFTATPPSLTVTFPAQVSPQTQNFCFVANGSHNDLEIIIVPITSARPGFTAAYKIIFKNKGTTPQSGSIAFNYNDAVMDYVSATVAPTSQSSGLLNFNVSALAPFSTREITVYFVLNTPSQVPPLNAGEILNFTGQIIAGADETPADNISNIAQRVVNSFDPNDKTCLEGASVSLSQVGDFMHYVIRFENNGTAAAQNVVVKDYIDPAKFDISSLIPLTASHEMRTRVTATDFVEFIFENIQLPFDAANNKGYVAFKIKTNASLGSGDTFENTANIYFDYNLPIITNTASTLISQTLGTRESTATNDLSFYPNPVTNLIYFKSVENLLKMDIFDLAGRKMGSAAVTYNQADLSFLKSGNYVIKVFSKNAAYAYKIIKK